MEEDVIVVKMEMDDVLVASRYEWLERDAHFEELLDTLECDFETVG